ncbi:MAG: hypothetical protein LBQ57_06450 [Spirochaetales bacterium]|jgi:two-component system sensor histidine kinase HydH|nr:hypothetical protein [Spirochaetales bacterium]
MPGRHTTGGGRLLFFVGTAGIFLLFTVLGYSFLRGQLYTNLLLARNKAEQTMNNLFTAMRQERFQEQSREPRRFRAEREFSGLTGVLDEYPLLKEKIAGIGVYSAEGENIFRYGDIPDRYPPPEEESPDGPLRNYVIDESSGNLHIVTLLPSQHMHRKDEGDRAAVVIFSVRQSDYWLRRRIACLVFAGWEIFLAIALWRLGSLLAKTRAYSRKLQEQKELVALGSAARTLAHEIKNPLSAIQLQADIIGRVCPEKVGAELDAITQEVARLRRLTDRIGDFLREPRGMPVPVDLGDFARNIVRRAGWQTQTPVHPDIPAFFAEEGVWIIIDPDRLQSIVENLLRNALESGSAPGEVRMKVFREGGRAVLEVLDKGEGLPDAEMGRLFDPFFTTKSKGSGVGLCIAWRFAEAAAGSLQIENREGGGVKAALEIPLAEEARK